MYLEQNENLQQNYPEMCEILGKHLLTSQHLYIKINNNFYSINDFENNKITFSTMTN